jgi:hypothetical protein
VPRDVPRRRGTRRSSATTSIANGSSRFNLEYGRKGHLFGVIGTRPCWPFIAKARVLALVGSAEVAVRSLRDFIEEEGGRRGPAAGAAGSDPH